LIKLWTDRAWEDYLYWQEQDKIILKKINRLIRDIERNGYDGIGKPESLRGNLSGCYSRRIDDKNRIVYRLRDDETVEILQCKGHYYEK
jgi:toxin YoeB